MDIGEAIRLLQKDIDDPGSVALEDVNEAEELGIKALIFTKNVLALMPMVFSLPKPGEAERREHGHRESY